MHTSCFFASRLTNQAEFLAFYRPFSHSLDCDLLLFLERPEMSTVESSALHLLLDCNSDGDQDASGPSSPGAVESITAAPRDNIPDQREI